MRRKWTCLALVFALVLTMLSGAAMAETTDQPKPGLQKVNGRYYFYDANGQTVKNTWKYISPYYYYFGADGAAYQSAGDDFMVICSVRKIAGKNYGFDEYAHRVTGVWVAGNGKAWVFKKNGTCNVKKTKQLRKWTKSKKGDKKLLKKVKKLIGKPKKTKVGKNSCNYFDRKLGDKHWDYTLRYPHVDVQLTKNKRTGKFGGLDVFGKEKK